MMRAIWLSPVLFLLAALAGCGEKPQTLVGSRGDIAAYQGVENRFAAPGWQAGDKANWEQGLKARMLYGQNEYSRTGVSK